MKFTAKTLQHTSHEDSRDFLQAHFSYRPWSWEVPPHPSESIFTVFRTKNNSINMVPLVEGASGRLSVGTRVR